MKKRKICVFTGSRSEYGLLYWLMQNIKKDRNLKLQIIVSGMHLSSEFGSTYKEIEKDGFKIDRKVNMHLSSENITGVAKSTGIGLILCPYSDFSSAAPKANLSRSASLDCSNLK